MEFNSQICTTKEQSERLLALGLKKETADMFYFWVGRNEYRLKVDVDNNPLKYNMDRTYIPAWSLHRLLKMLTYQVIYNDAKYEPIIAIDGMAYQDVCNDDPIVGWSGDLYTDVIDCVEWLIKEGYFNKEYLEE